MAEFLHFAAERWARNMKKSNQKTGGKVAINMFAGARRIALAFAGLWVLGCVAYAIFSEPYVSLKYSVETYGATPTPAESCNSKDARKFTTVDAPNDARVDVTFCFVSSPADDGSPLIPFRQVVSSSNPEAARVYEARKEALRRGAHDDAARLTQYLLSMPLSPWEPQTVWMANEYDKDVRAYMDGIAGAFRLQQSDLERVQQVKRQKLLDQWMQALQILFGGLAVGWALTALIGWIARGFLGIPRGKDHRPA